MIDVADRVIDLYGQYETLQAREAESPAADIVEVARVRVGEAITELLSDEAVRQSFLEQVQTAQDFDNDLELARVSGQVTDEELAEVNAHPPINVMMGRIALRFLSPAVEQEPRILPEMLQGSATEVAERLKGKALHVHGRIITIAETMAQPPEANKRWASKPLFGDNPVDFYVARYRAGTMVFVRASDKDSCVRIVSGVDQATGKKLKNSKQVCEHLALSGEMTGDVEVEDINVRVTIHKQHA